METVRITGKNRLSGEVRLQGAKNSALPILAAAASVDGVSVIYNCPRLSDVDAAIKILRFIGCKVEREGDTVTVDATDVSRYALVRYIFVATARKARHGGDIRARRLRDRTAPD